MKRKLNAAERLSFELLKALKGGKFANKVREGMDSDSDEDSSDDER